MGKYNSSVVPSDENIFDKMGYIDDEIDCVILGDDDVEKALEEIDECVKSMDSYLNESDEDDFGDDEIDEIIDSDQDYTNDVVDNSIEGADADEMLAAERDLAFDPFEDDDVIDAAINAGDDSPEELAED